MFLNKNTFTILFLTKKAFQKPHIRTMMAEGTTMTPNQRQLAALVLSIHANFLKKPNVDEKDLLQNFKLGMQLAGKPFQHFMTYLYCKKQFSPQNVRDVFPETAFEDKSFLNIDQVLAIASVPAFKTNPYFSHGHFYSLEAPRHPRPSTLDITSPTYKQTGQHFPDYHVSFPKYDYARYHDLKTGVIDPYKGHVQTIADPFEFEKISRELFYTQCQWLNKNHPTSALNKVVQQLKIDLKNGKYTDWKKFYENFLNVVQSNIKDYPNFNPSIVSLVEPSYEISQERPLRIVDNAVTTRSCESQEESISTLNKIFENGTQTMIDNYYRLNPLQMGQKNSIINQVFTLVKHVINQP